MTVMDIEEGSVIVQALVEVEVDTADNSTLGGGAGPSLPLTNLTLLALTSASGFPAYNVTVVQDCMQCAIGSQCNATTLQCEAVAPDERSPLSESQGGSGGGNRAGVAAGITVAVAVVVVAAVVVVFATKPGASCRRRVMSTYSLSRLKQHKFRRGPKAVSPAASSAAAQGPPSAVIQVVTSNLNLSSSSNDNNLKGKVVASCPPSAT